MDNGSLVKLRARGILFALLAIIALACTAQATPTAIPTSKPTPEPKAAAISTPTSAASPTPTIAPATAEARNEAPVPGGTLLLPGTDPPTLDPHLTSNVSSAEIIVEVFGGLLTYEAQDPENRQDPQLKIVGDLAEDWDVSDDGRTYTFHLRKNAKFHDGKPVTARDLKWSLERAADPATQAPKADVILGDILGARDKLEGLATEITGVRAIDDHTLSITTDTPKAYFLAKLTYPTAFVLDRENVENNPSWFREPNGTGPFRLAQYTPGKLLRLERNEYYHLGPPHLDAVQFIISVGNTTLMYQNNELHISRIYVWVTPEGTLDLLPLSREFRWAPQICPCLRFPDGVHSPARKIPPPAFKLDYIGMNTNTPPFDDRKVRQAFNYAIAVEWQTDDPAKPYISKPYIVGDPSSVNELRRFSRSIPASGIIPPGFPGYNKDLEGYDFDLDKARQLLKESKYGPDSEDFPAIMIGRIGNHAGASALATLARNLGAQECRVKKYSIWRAPLLSREGKHPDVQWVLDWRLPRTL